MVSGGVSCKIAIHCIQSCRQPRNDETAGECPRRGGALRRKEECGRCESANEAREALPHLWDEVPSACAAGAVHMLPHARSASAVQTRRLTRIDGRMDCKASAKSLFTLRSEVFFVNDLINCYNAPNIRAISSFGRAFPWHGKGDRFESGMVHRIRSSVCD